MIDLFIHSSSSMINGTLLEDEEPFKRLNYRGWENEEPESFDTMDEKIPNEVEDERPVAGEEVKGWSEQRWRARGGSGGVMLEGYVVGGPGDGERAPAKTRNLTDEDLEELKGCLDLGFGFSFDEIPELCGTLPALELCYSMSQMCHLDDHNQQISLEDSPPVASWRISSPGDNPDEVKARLKYWAQAVACTLRLCS